MMRTLNSLLWLALCIGMNARVTYASDPDDSWFEDDWQQKTEAVNEGQLEILQKQPDKPVHYHFNKIKISEKSIINGWVDMAQCHEHLDAVPALQIVFNKDRVRDIEIVSHRNIGRIWVEGNTVQLENIEHGSRLCLKAQTRALYKDKRHFVLKNGPFMRRFLDGYYPMRVRMEVEYPESKLMFVRSAPVAIAVDKTGNRKNRLEMDIWFSGQLKTEFIFRSK